MAKITDYPSITTIDANTILLADGSSGTGKILASDMAKYALETYAGSTLAGSAQSVKAALTGLAPQVKASIADLSTISPGEQGYFQLNASVSPTGATAYFTIWCTGNNDRRGIIAILTAESKTRFFAIAGHASSGVFAWKGWVEYPAFNDVVLICGGTPETVTSSTDVNNYTTPGTFFFNSPTKAANAPANTGYFRLVVTAPTGVLSGTNRVRYQEALTTTGVVYTRLLNSSNGGSTWTAQDWQKLPTRNEISRISWDTLGDVRISTELTAYIDSLAPGVYYRHSASADAAIVGAPVSAWCFYEIRKHGPEHVVVTATRGSTNGAPFKYQKEKYGATWDTAWRPISGGDASFTSRFSVGDTAKTITVPGSMRSLLVVTDANVDNSGLYFISTSSTGKATVREIIGSGVLDIDTSATGQVTLRATSSTVTLGCLFFCTNANVPTV